MTQALREGADEACPKVGEFCRKVSRLQLLSLTGDHAMLNADWFQVT